MTAGQPPLRRPALQRRFPLTAPQEPGRHPEGQDWLFSNVREGKSELVLCSSWAYATLGVPAMIAISSRRCMQTNVPCFDLGWLPAYPCWVADPALSTQIDRGGGAAERVASCPPRHCPATSHAPSLLSTPSAVCLAVQRATIVDPSISTPVQSGAAPGRDPAHHGGGARV